jgi:hypothetical protein
MALFFRQRKPRGFNYSPRYYDPDQEAREERKKIVLGEKYRSPAERAREAAGLEGRDPEYVPGSYVREHAAARRGNAHAADVMRRRRRKTRSVYVLLGMLVLIVLIVWMMYFK